MGSWGTGPFENDAALDLLAYVKERRSKGSVYELLSEAIDNGYEEDVVAAAALLAGGKWGDQRSLPLADERLTVYRQAARLGRGPDELRRSALQAILRILRSGSKLGWSLAKNERAWMGTVRRIADLLSGKVSVVRAPRAVRIRARKKSPRARSTRRSRRAARRRR